MSVLFKYIYLCIYILLCTNIYSQCIPVQAVLDVKELGCGNYKYHIELVSGSNPWVQWTVNGKTKMGSMDTVIRFTSSKMIYSKAIIGNDCGSITLENNFNNPYEKTQILSVDQRIENCSDVAFKVNFKGDIDGLTYLWKGEDLFRTKSEIAKHTYMLPGKFNYQVEVDNLCGDHMLYQGSIQIENTVTCSSGPDLSTCIDDGKVLLHGSPFGGQWFGKGLSGNIFNPSIVGEGKHELIYKYRENGCVAFDTTYITVEKIQPSAEFIQIKKTAPVVVDFISNTHNKNYEIIWDFGDGKTSFISNPTHEYTEPGIYFPKIEIYNPTTGCRSVNIFSNALIVEPGI
ncbi:MAG: hypothetical protein HYZ42_11935, partial [Bacteroidetes bacterium]|nr:hypothetical protein [Bacteroidota bacterium]